MFANQSDFFDAATLNDPVMSSFGAHWSGFAIRLETARALPKDIGPFASVGGQSEQ